MTPRPASSESAGALITILAVGLAIVLGMRSLHYLYFVALSLLPAGAAAVIEPRGERAATVAIASLTGATVLPLVLGSMTSGGHRDLLMSADAWAFVGAAVLCGLAIFLLLPAGTAWRADRRAKRRVRELRKRQEKLELEWGIEVRTTAVR